MTNALIIVDVQNDFVSGTLAVRDGDEVARRIGQHLNWGHYDYVVATQDWHVEPGDHFKTWPEHCKAFSWGAQLHDDIRERSANPPPGERGIYTTFHKGMYDDGYSGMFAEENEWGGYLWSWLQSFKVTDLDIVGLATDHCVKATALDAIDKGFKVRVITAYTAGVDSVGIEEARTCMRAAGVEIVDIVPDELLVKSA